MNNLFSLFTGFGDPYSSPEMMALKQACDGIERRAENFKKESAKQTTQWTIETERSDRQIQQRMAARYTDGFVTTPA